MPLFGCLLLTLLVPAPACALDVGTGYFCEDIKKPFFSSAPRPGGGFTVRNARPGSFAAEFLMPKPADTARVFIVGESAAGLLGSSEPELLKLLASVFPGKKTELVNCAMSAYESRRILAVLKEALDYAPDLVVVLSGNNEDGRDFCPDFSAELRRRTRELKARLAEVLQAPEDAAAAVSIEIHEGRLREMAGLAAGRGVPVLFCTLPANLRDFAPAGRAPAGLAAGIRELYRGSPARALALFAESGGPREPFSLFYSGRALEKVGRPAEAAASYAAAVKYDQAMDRTSAERNAMIRKVAHEEKACLADLEGAFSRVSGGGITGGDHMADGVHWFSWRNSLAGREIGRGALACLRPGAGPGEAGQEPVQPEPPGEGFRRIFAYAAAYAMDQASLSGARASCNERIVIMLERLCAMNCARLKELTLAGRGVRETLPDWGRGPGLRESEAAWRPTLLRAAAETFFRAGMDAEAAQALALSGKAVKKQ